MKRMAQEGEALFYAYEYNVTSELMGYNLSQIHVNNNKSIPNLVTELSGETELDIIETNGELLYTKNPFEVTLTIKNIGESPTENVEATLNLPEGVSLIKGEKKVIWEEILAEEVTSATWTIEVEPSQTKQVVEYGVSISNPDQREINISKSLFIPSIKYITNDDDDVFTFNIGDIYTSGDSYQLGGPGPNYGSYVGLISGFPKRADIHLQIYDTYYKMSVSDSEGRSKSIDVEYACINPRVNIITTMRNIEGENKTEVYVTIDNYTDNNVTSVLMGHNLSQVHVYNNKCIPNLVTELSGETELDIIETDGEMLYTKNPFEATLTIKNIGKSPVQDVRATLNLPEGVSLIKGEKTVIWEEILAEEVTSATWTIEVEPSQIKQVVEYGVSISNPDQREINISKNLLIPAIKYTLKPSRRIGYMYEQTVDIDENSLIPQIKSVKAALIDKATNTYSLTIEDFECDSNGKAFFYWKADEALFTSASEDFKQVECSIDKGISGRNIPITVYIGDCLGHVNSYKVWIEAN